MPVPLVASLPVTAGARARDRGRPRATRRERRIVAGLRRGDAEALRRIQEDYGRALLGYLTSALGERPAAEDVMQQVLLQAWQQGATYDPARGSLMTWLLAIARSRAIDAHRKRIPDPTDPAIVARTLGPEADQADALVERWQVAHLLGGLPRNEAHILRLRFFSGLSQREIAEQTGVPLGTVKMRMVQGLDRLRIALAAEGTTP